MLPLTQTHPDHQPEDWRLVPRAVTFKQQPGTVRPRFSSRSPCGSMMNYCGNSCPARQQVCVSVHFRLVSSGPDAATMGFMSTTHLTMALQYFFVGPLWRNCPFVFRCNVDDPLGSFLNTHLTLQSLLCPVTS